MHIMIVASKYLPEYTGAAYRIHNLYKSFGSDISAEVVCGGIERKNPEVYELDKIKITRLKDYSSGKRNLFLRIIGFYFDFFKTIFFLRNKNFDILHIVGTSSQTTAAYYYAYFLNKPLIIELVTQGAKPVMYLPLIGKLWAPRILKKSVIVAISEPLGAVCRETGFEKNVWIRPNPVNTDKFYPYKRDRKDLPFSENDFVISMVAKFMPQKNQIFLLEVIRHLPERYKIVMAGPVVEDGVLKERDSSYILKIESDIKDHGLQKRVHIIKGFIERPQDIIASSDLYVMPNMNEGLGTPLLEAQACGIPVIANVQEKAFHDHIRHGEDGYLLPLNAQIWAEHILGLEKLSKEEIQKRASYVAQNFSFERARKNYQRLLSALVQSKEEIDVKSILKAGHDNG